MAPLFYLAEPDAWAAACRTGSHEVSTRDRSLVEVGSTVENDATVPDVPPIRERVLGIEEAAPLSGVKRAIVDTWRASWPLC
jgi:hypothetical protein